MNNEFMRERSRMVNILYDAVEENPRILWRILWELCTDLLTAWYEDRAWCERKERVFESIYSGLYWSEP